MNLVEIKRPTPTFYVFWTITDLCNYKCSYCPPFLHRGFYATKMPARFPTNDQILKFIDNLVETQLNGKFLHMVISGGEPTTHPMFKTIIQKLHDKGSVEIVTNASRSVDWWKDMEHLPDKITISLHPEFSKLDKINETALYMLDNNVDLSFNLMCDPNNWDWVLAVKNNLDPRLYPHVDAKILTEHVNKARDGEVSATYLSNQLDFIKQTQSVIGGSDKRKRVIGICEDGSERPVKSFALINEGNNKFKGWSCGAGSEAIRVSFDGNVYAVCNIKLLGRLDTFKLEPQDIICPKDRCKCPSGITINKRKLTLSQDQ